MPICIECETPSNPLLRVYSELIRTRCRLPVQTLYTTYSKADDKALGKGVRLTQCPRCKSFADKYVEHDLAVLFIDLVLIKPQVRADLALRNDVQSHFFKNLLPSTRGALRIIVIHVLKDG